MTKIVSYFGENTMALIIIDFFTRNHFLSKYVFFLHRCIHFVSRFKNI